MQICFEMCNDGSNTHFGTQYGQQCFCVNDPEMASIDKHGELDAVDHCQMDCAGVDGSEMCGGHDEMSVYEMTTTTGTTTTETTTTETTTTETTTTETTTSETDSEVCIKSRTT